MGKRSKKPFVNSKEDKERKVKEECEQESKVDEEDFTSDVKEINFLSGTLVDFKYSGLLIGYLKQTITNLKPEEIEFVTVGDSFRIKISNRRNETVKNQELLHALSKCRLYIKTIVIPDSNKLRKVYQKYVDQNEDNTIKFKWSDREH